MQIHEYIYRFAYAFAMQCQYTFTDYFTHSQIWIPAHRSDCISCVILCLGVMMLSNPNYRFRPMQSMILWYQQKCRTPSISTSHLWTPVIFKTKTWEMQRCWIHFWATCASCLVCSVQQYLELRFNRATRLLGTVLFIIKTVSETLARRKVTRWLRGSWGIRILLVRRSCSPESSSTAQRWPWVRVCHCFSDICTQPHQPILLHEGFKNIINKKIAFKSYRAIFFPPS